MVGEDPGKEAVDWDSKTPPLLFNPQQGEGRPSPFILTFYPNSDILKIDGQNAMKFKVYIALLVFSLFFLHDGPNSFSQHMGRPWKKGTPCWKASELNLSLEQKKQLESIQQIFFRDTHRIRAELLSKRLEFRELLLNPNIKIEAVRSKYLEIDALQSKLDEKVVDYLIQVRALLTEEQIKNWCPEEEFFVFRPMRHRPGLISP